jgi:hypothetical protein
MERIMKMRWAAQGWRSISLVLLVVLTGACLHAADTPPTKPTNPQQYGQITAKLFELSADGKVDDAVEYSQIPKRLGREAADKFREHLAWPGQQGWKYLDSEVAASKTVSARVHEIYVLGHYDQGPVLLILRFYRADDGWFIQSFRFRNNLDDFIDSLPYDTAQHRERR